MIRSVSFRRLATVFLGLVILASQAIPAGADNKDAQSNEWESGGNCLTQYGSNDVGSQEAYGTPPTYGYPGRFAWEARSTHDATVSGLGFRCSLERKKPVGDIQVAVKSFKLTCCVNQQPVWTLCGSAGWVGSGPGRADAANNSYAGQYVEPIATSSGAGGKGCGWGEYFIVAYARMRENAVWVPGANICSSGQTTGCVHGVATQSHYWFTTDGPCHDDPTYCPIQH